MPIRTVPNPRAQSIEREVAKLVKMRLMVGIPGGAMHKGSKIDTSVIGYINEFGDDELHIPPRPFLVPGIEAVKGKIADLLVRGAAAVLTGASATEGAKGLHAAGLIAADAVKSKMQVGPFTPLAPATIYKRRHRKAPRDSEAPLIDTGELRNAVTYIIDKA